jgi:hypothetical protein
MTIPNASPPLPGAPTYIPVAPKPFSIAVGIALVGLSIWLIASWIPAHKPMSQVEAAAYVARCAVRGRNCLDHWMLNPKLYPWAYVIAGLLGFAGVARFFRGARGAPMHGVTRTSEAPNWQQMASPQVQPQACPACTRCRAPTTFVAQYNRYFCSRCNLYM